MKDTRPTNPATAFASWQPWRLKGIGVLRVIFGLAWAIDALFKWQPAFVNGFTSYLSGAKEGQPAWVKEWIGFWIDIVKVNPRAFAYIVAVAETAVNRPATRGVQQPHLPHRIVADTRDLDDRRRVRRSVRRWFHRHRQRDHLRDRVRVPVPLCRGPLPRARPATHPEARTMGLLGVACITRFTPIAEFLGGAISKHVIPRANTKLRANRASARSPLPEPR
jgi:hypothetical protein